MNAGLERNDGGAPSDSYVWITGPLFMLQVQANQDSYTGAYSYPVSPKVIAKRVGGTVIGG
jgi:hypothetical protein